MLDQQLKPMTYAEQLNQTTLANYKAMNELVADSMDKFKFNYEKVNELFNSSWGWLGATLEIDDASKSK